MRPQADAPYWQLDVSLHVRGDTGDGPRLGLQLHGQPQYFWYRAPLLPSLPTWGHRLYLHGEPYVIWPAASRRQQATAVGSLEHGIARIALGATEAWWYPSHQTVVLWECRLSAWCRREDCRQDRILAAVWEGLEAVLRQQIRRLRQIVTPSWSDRYPTRAWRLFLRGQGYQARTRRVYGKDVVV